MINTDSVQLFEDQPIRTAWNEEEEGGTFLWLMLWMC